MQQLRTYTRRSWENFEDETFDKWFPDDLFSCLHRTPYSFDLKKRYIQSANKPDFQFTIRGSAKSFWVECKQRSLLRSKYQFELFKPGQRFRYQKEKDVLIFLRLIDNGYPKYFLIPLNKLNSDFASTKQLDGFRIATHFPILPRLVEKYLP